MATQAHTRRRDVITGTPALLHRAQTTEGSRTDGLRSVSEGCYLVVLLLERVVVADDAASFVAVLVHQDGLVRQVAQSGKVLADVQDVRVHLHAFQLKFVPRDQIFKQILHAIA